MIIHLVQFRMGLASAAGVIAAASTAVALFIVFRVSAELTSLAAIGVWSLVQGVFLVSRIAEVGAGANITRTVVILRQEGRLSVVSVLLAGAIVSTLPTVLFGLLIVLPTRWFVADHVGAAEHLADVLPTLVWIALLIATTSSMNSVAGAIVEGHGALLLRNLNIIISNVVAASTCYVLVDHFGVVGIAAVTLLTTCVQLLLSLLTLVYLGMRHPGAQGPWRVVTSIWRENMRMSAVGLLRLSFEPVSKVLIAYGGSLADVASFELALRISTQFRVVFQSVAQPLLYVGSRKTLDMALTTRQLFERSQKLIAVSASSLTEPQLLLIPLISFLSFGSLRWDFTIFFVLLLVGNSVNMLGIVGYYCQLSSGAMGPLVWIQAKMAVMNLVFGILLTAAFGAIGAAIAYTVTFMFGGLASLKLMPGHHGQTIPPILDYWPPLVLVRLAGLVSVVFGIIALSGYVSPVLLTGTATLFGVLVGLVNLPGIYRFASGVRDPRAP
ncbi:hypothetical protein [Xanthobacter wiegelii]|uniref:hypothetical protein n=1 Tax=Xanthobacter wiegelii TaxID=3119913 RepID=UPI003729C165